jgi:HlyD family type I secretion membrane fusion protein
MARPPSSFATDIDAGLPPAPVLWPIARAMAALIAIAFFGFGGWAAVAEISSAAVAPGVVVVGSHRKVVQHLEGGIVRRLLVNEGAIVHAGQVLIELGSIRATTDLAMVRLQIDSSLAKLVRLEAELAGQDSLVFPPELLAQRSRSEIARVLDDQIELFHMRRRLLAGQVESQSQQISLLQGQIRHNDEQARANDMQTTLVREEIDSLSDLVAKGYVTKTRMLALQRTQQELLERRAALAAARSHASEGIAAAEIAIQNLSLDFRRQASAEIDAARGELTAARERLANARDIVDRLQILAPQDGKVVGLKVFNEGSVVGPGEALMEIVPQHDELLVEVQVSPLDIDSVVKGLSANVRLTALKQRDTPLVAGEVIDVSGDRIVNDRGEPYYLARIRLGRTAVVAEHLSRLYPGMPAQAYIITGSRTALRYLLSPLLDATYSAFRER